MEFRAYDNQQKRMVYNNDLWLPHGLNKLGHKEYPVHVTNNGIQYTLNCISNHYENDWEEDVISILNIEIMQSTDSFAFEEPGKKLYSEDIISFRLEQNPNYTEDNRTLGRIKYSEQDQDWIVVDQDEQFIERLSKVTQSKVLGNWYDNPELLGKKIIN
jgi:hypothetical protein